MTFDTNSLVPGLVSSPLRREPEGRSIRVKPNDDKQERLEPAGQSTPEQHQPQIIRRPDQLNNQYQQGIRRPDQFNNQQVPFSHQQQQHDQQLPRNFQSDGARGQLRSPDSPGRQ